VWGQLDLLAPVFAVFSLVLAFSERGKNFSFAVFVFALLIKFQTIAFLPAFAAVWLARLGKDRRGICKSILSGLCVFALVCLPFALSGNLLATLQGAYFNTVGSYAVATFYANNLWMVWPGPGVSDAGIRFIAIALFGVFSLLVFWRALKASPLERGTLLAAASGAAFFFLLPQMHERYLVQTLPFLLLLAAKDFKTWPWLFLATLLCLVNLFQMNHLIDNKARLLSIFAVGIFGAFSLFALFPGAWKRCVHFCKNVALPFWLPEVVLALACLVTSFYAWSMQ
jgi:hypothetical protein